jgi:hypothetical protein
MPWKGHWWYLLYVDYLLAINKYANDAAPEPAMQLYLSQAKTTIEFNLLHFKSVQYTRFLNSIPEIVCILLEEFNKLSFYTFSSLLF